MTDPSISVKPGLLADGRKIRLPLAGGHLLVAGSTGSGKSTTVNSLLDEVRRRPDADVCVVGIDAKLGVELGPWEPMLAAFAKTADEAGLVLRIVADAMALRYEKLEAQGRRLWIPGVDGPLLWLVIDELAQILGSVSSDGKAAAGDRAELLAKIAALGRAAGVAILAATQLPEAALTGSLMRAQFVRRAVHRLMSVGETEISVGKGSAALAPAHLLSPQRPGLAWWLGPDWPVPVMGRCRHLDDEAVEKSAAQARRVMAPELVEAASALGIGLAA